MTLRPLLCLFLLQAVSGSEGEVRGRILLKSGAAEGGLDVHSGGRRGGYLSALVILEDKVPMMKESGPLRWDDVQGLSFHFTRLPAGKRLFSAGWRVRAPRDEQYGNWYPTHYLDGQWVDVKPPDPKGTTSDVILTVEPSVCGDVEVSVGPDVAAGSVSFMPADAEGRVPEWADRRYGAAYEEKVQKGKATFEGMKPGKYVFYPTPDRASLDVPPLLSAAEVKAKNVTQIRLGRDR